MVIARSLARILRLGDLKPPRSPTSYSMYAAPPRLCACLAACLLLPSLSVAQTEAMAAADSMIVVGASTAVTSGTLSSASGMASVSLGNPIGNAVSISESCRVRGNAIWMPNAPETSDPIISGFANPLSLKGGGVIGDLYGFNLNQGLLPIVKLDGVPANNAHAVNNLHIVLTIPQGKDAFNNPKGEVDTVLELGPTQLTGEDFFTYMPVLSSSEVPHTSEFFDVHLYSKAGSLAGLFLGGAAPFFPLPLPPLGTLMFTKFPIQLGNFVFNATGVHKYHLPIPDVPALIGLELEMQAVVIANLVTGFGSLTPLFTTTVQD